MQRFKNILCVAISDPDSRTALERAADLARNNQARLTVVEVIEEIPSKLKLHNRLLSTADLQLKSIQEHQKRLQALVVPWSKKIEIQTKVLVGISFLEIIREVLRSGCDLVIKTAENGGLLDRVFGSDDMHLLRKSPCPVWLVKSESPKKYVRILAAVDVDSYYPEKQQKNRDLLNLQILEMASSLALSEFSELHIINVWEAIGESMIRNTSMNNREEEVIAYVEEVKEQHEYNLKVLLNKVTKKLGPNAMDYLQPQTHLLRGFPNEEIPAYARHIGADIVVMGTVARTGIAGFFIGNTAETILNRLGCSVLAVKPAGFVTPVTLDN